MSYPYMPMFVRDYMLDTSHLTCEQSGAYLHLLFTMWEAGGYLPNDDKKLSRMARAGQRWGHVKQEVMTFFVIEGDCITHLRLKSELQNCERRSAKQRDRANARWLKNKETPDATAMPDGCLHINSHINKEKEYRFSGQYIRLTNKGFTDWRTAYPSLDLDAELRALDDWLGSQAGEAFREDWFFKISGALKNKHLAVKAKAKPIPAGPFKPFKPEPVIARPPKEAREAQVLKLWKGRGRAVNAMVRSDDEEPEGSSGPTELESAGL